MMLKELKVLFATSGNGRIAVTSENLLGKSSNRARKAAYKALAVLYGLTDGHTVPQTLRHLWPLDRQGQPLLALLCALARDPTLREAAAAVLDAPLGEPVRAAALAAAFEAAHPERLGPNSLASLSRNAASTWTQAGFLHGKIKKCRSRPVATPAAAAFAAMLAELSGFTGERLLTSRWLDILDVPAEDRLGLLRRAEGFGWARVRSAGDVLEITAVKTLTTTLGMVHHGGR